MNDITPSLDREKSWSSALDTLDGIERRAALLAKLDELERRTEALVARAAELDEEYDTGELDEIAAELAAERAIIESAVSA